MLNIELNSITFSYISYTLYDLSIAELVWFTHFIIQYLPTH